MMKSLSPKPTPPQVALENYNTLLNDLTIADKNFTKEQGLELLTARDFLQKQLEANSPISAKIWTVLTEQDTRLKKQAYKITQVLNLSEYRESLLISEQAWWWYLGSALNLWVRPIVMSELTTFWKCDPQV